MTMSYAADLPFQTIRIERCIARYSFLLPCEHVESVMAAVFGGSLWELGCWTCHQREPVEEGFYALGSREPVLSTNGTVILGHLLSYAFS